MAMAINDPSFFLEVQDPEEEMCDWLVNNIQANKLSVEKLRSWMKIDEREMCVPPEQENYQFCSSDLAIEVDLKTSEKAKIRRRVNPFELIGNAGFSSRTTVKAANLDYLVNFTEPLDQQGQPLIDDNAGLCYSDIFGDPDGFVEYIEWRRRAKNTKKIDLSSMCHRKKSGRSFKVSDPLVMDRFITYVRNSDVGAGLNLLCVDYYAEGISMEKPKTPGISMEVYVKNSTLSYCLLALKLLRRNGSFILKIYKSQKLFTVGLLYLMYRCFEKVAIVKPISSRPDHSERYVICKWKKSCDQTEIIRQYLYGVSLKLNDLEDSELDVMQLVPFEILKADKTFFDFIYDKNDMILKNILQCVDCIQRNLDSEVIFHDPRKIDFKQRCIRLWDIAESEKFKPPFDNWRRRDIDRAGRVTEVSKIENWRQPNK